MQLNAPDSAWSTAHRTLVIDEGQNFHRGWYELLRQCAASPATPTTATRA